MAKLTPAHRGQFVAICATRNEATPRVNAAGGSDEVKRAGGSGIFSHAGSIPQSSLTARLFLFFFFSCNLLSMNELRRRGGAAHVTR